MHAARQPRSWLIFDVGQNMSDEKPALFIPGIGQRGMTALHFAAYCGDGEELVRCIAAGMDPNKKDKYRGYTTLHWLADMAATAGPRLEMMRMLVQAGADINARSNDGASVLSLARSAGSQAGDDLAAELVTLGAQP